MDFINMLCSFCTVRIRAGMEEEKKKIKKKQGSVKNFSEVG